MYEFSFTKKSLIIYHDLMFATKQRKNPINTLFKDKALTQGMAWKVACSGLELKHLQAAYLRHENGVQSILSEKFNNGIRVTNCKRVITKINEWLECSLKVLKE